MLSALLLLAAVSSATPPLQPTSLAGRLTVQRLPGGDSATVLAIDPQRPTRLYAGGAGIFRSDDYGVTWTTLDLALRPVSLAVDPSDGRRVYALSENHLWGSDDEGGSWDRLNEPPGLGGTFLVDAAGVVYASCTEGIFKSLDGGQNWLPTGSGVPSTASLAATDLSQAGVLYAIGPANAGWGGSIYKSTDGAASWIGPILTTPLEEQITAIAVGGRPQRTVFAETFFWKAVFSLCTVWGSDDQGTTWQPFVSPSARPVPIAADPVRSGTVYTPGTGGICEIASPGRCVVVSPPDLDAQTLTVSPDGRALYLITYPGEVGAIRLDLPMRVPRAVTER